MVIQKVTLSPWSLPSLICAVPPGSPSTVPVISESPFSDTLIGTSCSLYLNDPAHVPVISAAGAIAAIKRSSPVNVRWRLIRTHSIKGPPPPHHPPALNGPESDNIHWPERAPAERSSLPRYH